MPKVIRVGQPVCKIKHVLQKSVILDESSTFEPEKKIRRNWSRKLHVKEPKACISTMIHDSMTNSPQLIFLASGKLPKTTKSQHSSHRLASEVGCIWSGIFLSKN